LSFVFVPGAPGTPSVYSQSPRLSTVVRAICKNISRLPRRDLWKTAKRSVRVGSQDTQPHFFAPALASQNAS
jgi:hypothetical protein